MAGRKTLAPKRGSRRVEGWVYEVINPILEALPTEISFLEGGNLTWRFLSRNLEHLRPLEEYLSPQGSHILRDFQLADRQVRQRFSKHDSMLNAIAKSASAAYDALIRRGDFQQKVQGCLNQFMEGPPGLEFPGGEFLKDKFHGLVAEHVINNVTQLPSYHTDSKFWGRFGRELLAFRSDPAFGNLEASRGSFVEYDRSLIDWLKKKSFTLCAKYDIPAAPLSGARRQSL